MPERPVPLRHDEAVIQVRYEVGGCTADVRPPRSGAAGDPRLNAHSLSHCRVTSSSAESATGSPCRIAAPG
jgi:hypothetical protein